MAVEMPGLSRDFPGGEPPGKIFECQGELAQPPMPSESLVPVTPKGLFCERGEHLLDLVTTSEKAQYQQFCMLGVSKAPLARGHVPPKVELETPVCLPKDTSSAPSPKKDHD